MRDLIRLLLVRLTWYDPERVEARQQRSERARAQAIAARTRKERVVQELIGLERLARKR